MAILANGAAGAIRRNGLFSGDIRFSSANASGIEKANGSGSAAAPPRRRTAPRRPGPFSLRAGLDVQA
jgi:hypothetical protein